MDNQTIGKRMQKLRRDLKLSSTELADRIGISQAQVSRLENGKQGFRSGTLTKIADALGVQPLYFYLEDGQYDAMRSPDLTVYGAIAHPRLAQALTSPVFLAVAERLADIFLQKPDALQRIFQD